MTLLHGKVPVAMDQGYLWPLVQEYHGQMIPLLSVRAVVVDISAALCKLMLFAKLLEVWLLKSQG